MNLIIFSSLLMSIFFVQVSMFPSDLWKENAENFVEQSLDFVKEVTMNNASCYELGKLLLLRQKKKIADDFTSCGQFEICYEKVEEIFHQRVENIRAEMKLCGENVCEDTNFMDNQKDFVHIQDVIDKSANCSFLSSALVALNNITETTKNWGYRRSNTEGLKNVESALEIITHNTFDNFRECKDKMVNEVKLRLLKDLSNHQVYMKEKMQEIKHCTEEYMEKLESSLLIQKDYLRRVPLRYL